MPAGMARLGCVEHMMAAGVDALLLCVGLGVGRTCETAMFGRIGLSAGFLAGLLGFLHLLLGVEASLGLAV